MRTTHGVVIPLTLMLTVSHPIVTRLVDAETLEKMGASKAGNTK